MGDVVQLNDYRADLITDRQEDIRDSLIPVEFAVGLADRRRCLKKIDEYGIRDVQIHRISDDPQALLCLMGVRDAIWLNKKILEQEKIGDEEIAQRIDLIQMLENADLAMLQALWQSFNSHGTATR